MKKALSGLISFLIAVLILFLAVRTFSLNVFSHNAYDSYTRQALAWKNGTLYLDEDPRTVAYLELAEYDGRLYVSFPPVPTLVELITTTFWGAETPNQAILYLYAIFSAVALTLLFARRCPPATAICYGLLFSFGGNFLPIIAFGGVWHEAQGLAFLLCSLAVWLCDGEKPWQQALGLFLSALAVGCRPFTALFIPFLLWHIFQKKSGRTGERVAAMVPYLVAPALVAVGLMVLNFVRFGNVFEFGHNYLPEFQREENGQFSFVYLAGNLKQAFSLPKMSFENGKLAFQFDMFTGTAFYLVNIGISVFLYYVLRTLLKPGQTTYNLLFLGVFVLFVMLTCMHRTLGGCQFGARYFMDALPYLAFFVAQKKEAKAGVGSWTLAVFGVGLNFLGAGMIAQMF